MIPFTILIGISVGLIFFVYQKQFKPEMGVVKGKDASKGDGFYLYCLLAVAFVVRVIAALSYYGYETDMNCFHSWSAMVYEGGFGQFYQSGAFTDYPPGYMYVLYIIGWIRTVLGLDGGRGLGLLIIKLPAILSDLALGFLIYKVASKRFCEWGAWFVAALFLLHPAIILDSSTWGQVDSVFTFFSLLSIYWFANGKRTPAYFAFVVAVLMKPQALVFTPILIYAIIEQVFLTDFSWKKFWREWLYGLSAIAAMFLTFLPFGVANVLLQYRETLASYEYASVNAYNFWALFGKNWTSQEESFLYISYNHWGSAFLVLTVALSAYLFFRADKEDKSKYYFSAATIVIGMFFLSVRMHERYMYASIPLLLLAFSLKPRFETFLAYALWGAVGFLNMAHILFYYDPENYDGENPVIFWVSLLSLVAFVSFCHAAIKHYARKGEAEEAFVQRLKEEGKMAKSKNPQGKDVSFQLSERGARLDRTDWIWMSVIIVVYSLIAFYDLGEMRAPETKWESKGEGEQIVLDLGEVKYVKDMEYFLGNYEGVKYVLEVSESPDSGWESVLKPDYENDMDEGDKGGEPYMKMHSVFSWETLAIERETRFLRLSFRNGGKVLFELGFRDADGENLTPVNAEEYPTLFDEQDLVPERRTFRNSTYFDEIYHARTAYEYIHGLRSYENTHPPLGKGIIALGVLTFGMNPFGWRFMGTLLGVLMIPIFYLFAKKMLKQTWLTVVTTLLFTFDFMHFAQTRIATIDVYGTFFILIMYYFMFRYTKLSFYDTDLKKTLLPLGLSGIAMGFGVASKWTGAYAGVGLAVIFFLTLYRRYREYAYASKRPSGTTDGVRHALVIERYHKYVKWTLLFCLVFFVLLPATIYTLSYLPFSDESGKGVVSQMLKNQTDMLNYHKGVKSPHPYSSRWYQWPVMTRPIWYYSGQVSNTLKEGISAFGNPLVWWVGIPAFVYMLYLCVKKKDETAKFLVIAYLAQYLPWVLISRVTFIYHYFPSVPFVVLMLGYSMWQIYREKPKLKYAMWAYAGAACLLFVLFYPVLAGRAVDVDYVGNFLKWFDSWVLINIPAWRL